ncbi:tRNA (adenosine(37)-N6)-threonylcarbamoyltransferase complex dimerization subunit type 1 TsaB [Desulfuromonas versatilis]|uniref:tRNA (Adenosine(37)-N6)-threonylcarbamoyltransferase complex dimerization subunit type 1 TsaB n=1 Tax=Desulfuromonas versatilis TaxID=2802975 RepID=A0ABM8HWG3_9BACT|nr:tRNA (adenosine(37)-N6)-threonylcarbamoyltransferase complex dimerization subunit type 1 TsaB [Desulfuromonas versatilis]BCR05459.1 tRNA (adenosine(37)-N6)-threonylcarbamoyltransferase complex dimerization subunit type 1 TsaB [Desulfuromonas versatilis]
MDATLLTLDTSTQAGSVALTRGRKLLGEILLNVKANHTDRLLATVRQLLGDAGVELGEIDGFGVVLGPGSFTGLRVGLATVKGLALACAKPVLGVSSLRSLAVQAPFARHPVCTLLDARKGEVYAGLYGGAGGRMEPLMDESVLPPEKLLSRLEGETVFIGDGAVVYQTLIVRQLGSRAHFVPWPLNLPRASSAAALALEELEAGRSIPLEQLRPAYIRPSEAEIMWARRQEEASIEG